MTRFVLHQFKLGARHYILLPKLNDYQMRGIEDHLLKRGFKVANKRSKSGSRPAIHLDPSGFCWSVFDPSDAIIPIINWLIDSPKEKLAIHDLKEKYFSRGKSGIYTSIRFSTRIESSHWRILRGAGLCGLTPDEATIIRLFARHAGERIKLLTDYPLETSKPKKIIRRNYYESWIQAKDVPSILTEVGNNKRRNAFLPERFILRMQTSRTPPQSKFLEAFESMGDWCGFTATTGKL